MKLIKKQGETKAVKVVVIFVKNIITKQNMEELKNENKKNG